MSALNGLAALAQARPIFEDHHHAFRETARRFFVAEIEPNVREWERQGHFPRELFVKAGKYGLLCPGIGEEYGGGGGDLLHHIIVYEEHGYSPAGPSLEAGLNTDTSAYALFSGGTEAQKRLWLPGIASGEVIAEVGLTEAHSGSDPRSIRTTARRDGDDYVINGSKMWVSNAGILTMLMVVAKAEGGASMFLVPMDSPGVSVSRPIELMLKGCGTVCEVGLDEVRIPASHLVGGVEGRGFNDAFSIIGTARLALAARIVATCELALAQTIDYTRERQAFGQPVFDYQNTQFKLAGAKAEISVARGYLDGLLQRARHGAIDQTDTAIAKLWISEMEQRVLDECLQLFGGAGYSDEVPISKMYSFARLHRIFLGTSEMQRISIARSLVK